MLKEFYYLFFIRAMNRRSKSLFGSKITSITDLSIKAYLNVSFFQILNLYCAWRIANYLNLIFIAENRIAIWVAIIVSAILLTNYFFLFRKRKEILLNIDEFSAEKIKYRKIFFVGYVIASVLLFGFIRACQI